MPAMLHFALVFKISAFSRNKEGKLLPWASSHNQGVQVWTFCPSRCSTTAAMNSWPCLEDGHIHAFPPRHGPTNPKYLSSLLRVSPRLAHTPQLDVPGCSSGTLSSPRAPCALRFDVGMQSATLQAAQLLPGTGPWGGLCLLISSTGLLALTVLHPYPGRHPCHSLECCVLSSQVSSLQQSTYHTVQLYLVFLSVPLKLCG
ncbi:uncharacterized protein LOC109117482 [Fukomys damarensis]|uniref:uncharacterized protein LOC109117482 n=1 Tax=Fukomys damarensis TaxID=885580 RepID=UPI0008FF30ED|nr:uncharacterized protein LOC109117482 [Fukomys damarensis]